MKVNLLHKDNPIHFTLKQTISINCKTKFKINMLWNEKEEQPTMGGKKKKEEEFDRIREKYV